MDKAKKIYPYFLISTALIFLDQITKLLVKGFDLFGMHHDGIPYGSVIPIIGSFLQLTYIDNAGMAFGISFGAAKVFLSLFSIVASVVLGWYLNKLRPCHGWVKFGVSLILAGAMGNLIDRVFYGVIWGDMPLFYGKVVDFIQVDIPDINFFGIAYTHFPVFNVADSCVTCGVILLLLVHRHIPGFNELMGKPGNLDEPGQNSAADDTDGIKGGKDE